MEEIMLKMETDRRDDQETQRKQRIEDRHAEQQFTCLMVEKMMEKSCFMMETSMEKVMDKSHQTMSELIMAFKAGNVYAHDMDKQTDGNETMIADTFSQRREVMDGRNVMCMRFSWSMIMKSGIIITIHMN